MAKLLVAAVAKHLPHGLGGFALWRMWQAFGLHITMAFIPLLLLNRGLTLWEVCAFYAVSTLFSIGSYAPLTRFIVRYGLRVTFVAVTASHAACQVVLGVAVASLAMWSLSLFAIVLGFTYSITALAVTTHLAQTMNGGNRGRGMGFLLASFNIFAALAPLVGMAIATLVSPAWLPPVAAGVILIGLLHVRKLDPKLKAPPLVVRYRPLPPWRDLIAGFAFQYHATASMVVWPVYLAKVVPGFTSIGLLAALATLVASIAGPVLNGFRVDSGRSRRVMLEALIVIFVLHALRTLSTDWRWITIITAVFGAAFACCNVAWYADFHHLADKEGITYTMAMEAVGSAACAVLWGGLAILAAVGHETLAFQLTFAAAAVVALGCLALRPTPAAE